MMRLYFVEGEFELIPTLPLLLERAVDDDDGVESDEPSEEVETERVPADAKQLDRSMVTWSIEAITILIIRSPGSQ